MTAVRMVLVGAGLIGRRHAELMTADPDVSLTAIVDPAPAARELAEILGVPHFATLDDVPAGLADAAVIATPNDRHEADAIACANRGWPVLVEKPIAETPDAARRMIAAFTARDLPLLVGHHRRHHPFVARARTLLNDGEIGRVVMASVVWAVRKHDTYFDAAWRTRVGAGPVMINLIHEVDMLRHLLGDIVEVRGMGANAQRGHEVEDTAAALVRLESGALASIAITDAGLSPWSFEAASGENPDIAESGAHSWRIVGTEGALEFPRLRLWKDAERGVGNWSRPLAAQMIGAPEVTPVAAQLQHFVEVVRGEATPLVSGEDALASLEATEAVSAAIQADTRRDPQLHTSRGEVG